MVEVQNGNSITRDNCSASLDKPHELSVSTLVMEFSICTSQPLKNFIVFIEHHFGYNMELLFIQNCIRGNHVSCIPEFSAIFTSAGTTYF